jgi:hypothetical protein
METVYPTGNSLLRFIAQKIERRRRQDQSGEQSAQPNVLEFSSTPELSTENLYEQPTVFEQPVGFEQTSALEQSEVFEQPTVFEPPVVIEQNTEFEQPEVFEQPTAFAQSEVIEEPTVFGQPEVVEKPALFERPAVFDAPTIVAVPQAYEPPSLFELSSSHMDLPFVDDLIVPLNLHEIESDRVSDSELHSFTLPPPDFAEFDSYRPETEQSSESAAELFLDEMEQTIDSPAAMEIVESDSLQSVALEYHGGMSKDDRHFLLWQYVGGELIGNDREALHAHILRCKDCASYVWKLTSDSFSKPATLDDPIPKPSVPLPSLEEPESLDEWIKPSPDLERSAYVWRLATAAPEARIVSELEYASAEPISRAKQYFQSLSPRRKALIAVVFAATALISVAVTPGLRGGQESSDLRAKLKNLEAKSEQLRKEVEEGKAVRDQLLQVQKETDLVRRRYENAQGAFQKISGEVPDSVYKSHAVDLPRPFPITMGAPPSDSREIDAVLNDGNGQVTIDTNGDIVGLPPLAGDIRKAVRTVLREHSVHVPALPDNLDSESGTTTTPNGAARDGIMLVSPVATMVEWTRPTLNWMPVGGAVSYKVQVHNASGQMVAQGEASAGTEWTVPESLTA